MLKRSFIIIVNIYKALKYLSALFKKSFGYISKNKINKYDYNLANKLIIDSSKSVGVDVSILPHDYLRLKFANQIYYSKNSIFSFESLIAYKMCGDKLITSIVLTDNDIPVPKFKSFKYGDLNGAISYFKFINTKVVVKPCTGTSGGKGVSFASSLSEFIYALIKAFSYSKSIIVEEFVKGEGYRITILDGKPISVVKRIAAHVVGDGVSSIRKLIDDKNNTLNDPSRETRLIRSMVVDSDVKKNIYEKSYNLTSVLSENEILYLRKTDNVTQGAEILDVTKQCHSDYLDLAICASKALNVKLAGVDLIADDISQPYRDGSAYVNEVNTTPGLAIVREPDQYGQVNTIIGEEILRHQFDINA